MAWVYIGANEARVAEGRSTDSDMPCTVEVAMDGLTLLVDRKSPAQQASALTVAPTRAAVHNPGCLFLHLLPLALQVTILMDWLCVQNGNCDRTSGHTVVLAISRLDVDCCCRALRPLFLELAKSVKLSFTGWKGRGFSASACYLRWLFTREVAVPLILFDESWPEDEAFPQEVAGHLRSVITVNMTDRRFARDVLNTFPNVSYLYWEFSDRYYGYESVWRLFAQFTHLPLTTIHVSDDLEEDTIRVVRLFGDTLMTLAVGSCEDVSLFRDVCQTVGNCCRQLTILTLDLEDHHWTYAAPIFLSCSQLTDLTLSHFEGTDQDMFDLVGACQSLRELYLSDYKHDANFKIVMLAVIVNMFPQLDVVQIDSWDFAFQRDIGHLGLGYVDDQISTPILINALKALTPMVVEFDFRMANNNTDMFAQVCRQMSDMNIQALGLLPEEGVVLHEEPVVKFLLSCKSLRFVCGTTQILSREARKLVEESCPHFEFCPHC